MSLLDRRLVFVTGKGGVGKTTIAAALAQLGARAGKRTLVCEMDAKGALADAFDVTDLEFRPRAVDDHLWAMAMSTEDALREYLRLFVRLPFAGRLGPLAPTLDFVADAAPGVKEVLAIGKLCYEVRERHYDLVVVDAEASGHVVAQIGAPKVIRDLVQVGLVREQTQWMLDILHDPAFTGVAIVVTPEEMPVTESIELVDRLHEEAGVGVTTIVANRVLPALFDRRQQTVVDRLAEVEPLLVAAAGKDVAAVVEAARVTEARRRVGSEHLGRLRTRTAPIPIVYVPELFTRATGRRVVTLVTEALADELVAEAS